MLFRLFPVKIDMLGSDRRVKRDLNYLNHSSSGLPIYTFKYIGDERIFQGVMAQDVQSCYLP